VKLRYFAWVRERIGLAEEEIDPPAGVATVGELVAWLTRRHVRADARIDGAHEIAFFPPMTGG
jgi:molybdopterin synthase sulfur carrier subunit